MNIRNMVKAFMIVFIIMALMLPGAAQATEESSYNNITMTPANELALSLGGTFLYNHSTLTGSIIVGENELSYRLDNVTVKYNGKYVTAPAPMKIINNRFMVPVEFTKAVFGVQSTAHTVISGDTLWKISVKYGTTITTIKQLND